MSSRMFQIRYRLSLHYVYNGKSENSPLNYSVSGIPYLCDVSGLSEIFFAVGDF
ncbi:MAG: hypothetical protein MUO60_09360 [Clostridiaceae bacterium]|nr:hypothetical protein [Clostridiaceae bacterium]